MLTIGAYHPAFILRKNARLNGIMKADFAKAIRLSKGWRPQWTDENLLWENVSADDAVTIIDSMAGTVSYDVETDGRHPLECALRCLALYDGTKGFTLPLLYRTGEREELTFEEVKNRSTGETTIKVENRAVWKRCYGDTQEKRIKAALDRLWKRARPLAQNGQYDRTVLRARWNHVVPQGDDTILLHHVLRPYLPHGLGFLSSLYTDIPYYKATDSGDSWAAETDAELYLYCLHADTRVRMADGTTERIQDLVRTRSTAEVLSYNERTKRVEPRPIKAWFTKRVPGQEWIQFETACGTSTVTPDHYVRTSTLWVQAQTLKKGDRIISDELQWSEAQRQIVLGTLLGDTSLRVSPAYRPRRLASKTAYLEGGHVNAAHAQWKARALGLTAVAGGKLTKFRSRGLVQLGDLLPLFYDARGRRRLHPEVYGTMRARGWAHFFMDDGCVQKQLSPTHREGMVLALRRYPKEDRERLHRWFKNTFGPCSLSAVGTLHLAANTAERFARYIAPHVHPSCRYKLPAHLRDAVPFVDDVVPQGEGALAVPILRTGPRKVPRIKRAERFKAETRYCIEVERNHNFFTSAGLVKNCARDVKTTWEVWNIMKDELAAARPEDARVYEQDLWQEARCQEWKARGIKLDPEALEFFRHHYRSAANKALGKMRELVSNQLGGSKSSVHLEALTEMLMAKADEETVELDGTVSELFNPGSLRQLRQLLKHLGVPLEALTATGDLSTAKEFLTQARKDLIAQFPKGDHPGVAFLDYLFAWREASKVNSTYLFPEILTDGRVHPTFNVHVVPTGRLSSTGPNCFSGDTELLTPTGWKRIDAWVTAPGVVAQWHPEDNTLSWTAPTDVIQKESSDWAHIHNDHIDLLVTADHRCPVFNRDGTLKVVPASDYPEDHRQVNAVNGIRGDGSGIELSDDELRLVIATQADGSYSGGGLDFSLTKPRKVQRMRDLLRKLKLGHSERARKPNPRSGSTATRFYVRSCELVTRIQRLLGPDKLFGPWLGAMSSAQRQVFMDEVMRWDGCATRMNHYASMHRENASWVQTVFVLSGRRANLRECHPKPNAWGSKAVSYQVDVSSRGDSWTTNRVLERSTESAQAYCLSVPSTFVIVRRNGKVMVSGQCQNQPAEIRGMYVPEDGYDFVFGDWDALEMRLGAFMSQDPAFVDAFRQYDAKTGPKPHIVNMGNIFGLPKTKEAAEQHPGMYRAAKVFAYAVAYGAGDATVFEQVREELPDMDPRTFGVCMKNYKAAYPKLFEFQEQLVRDGTRYGYIDTRVMGRRGYFFEQPSYYDEQSPEASAMQNFPYQGTGADIVGQANRRILDRAHEFGVDVSVIHQLAQIHDELLFEVPEALSEKFKHAFEKLSGESPKGFEHWNLPVEVKSAKRWKPVQTRCSKCRELTAVEPFDRSGGVTRWGGECKKCQTKTTVEVPRKAA